METPVELNAYAWHLMFSDLSLDAPRPYLAAMGLNRPEDLNFIESLAPLVDYYANHDDDERHKGEAVRRILHSARQYGEQYPTRIMDWGRIIYPNDSERQHQIVSWRRVVMGGAMRVGEKGPRIVEETRATLRKFVPVTATDIEPAGERDKLYCLDRGDEGISSFEWVEAAVRTYRFLYAWNLVLPQPRAGDELDQVYSWALREAEVLRFPKGGLGRPEEPLTLPASLKDS